MDHCQAWASKKAGLRFMHATHCHSNLLDLHNRSQAQRKMSVEANHNAPAVQLAPLFALQFSKQVQKNQSTYLIYTEASKYTMPVWNTGNFLNCRQESNCFIWNSCVGNKLTRRAYRWVEVACRMQTHTAIHQPLHITMMPDPPHQPIYYSHTPSANQQSTYI